MDKNLTPAEYLNRTVWATLNFSDIDRIGVVAIRDIPKGTHFTDYDVYNTHPSVFNFTEEDFEKILPEIRNLILDRTILQDGKIICVSPNSNQDLRSWMNHSASPNVEGWKVVKDIKKGEELTEDYRWFPNWHKLTKEHYSSFV